MGEKDTRLLREAAAERDTHLSLADGLSQVFVEARAAGLAQEDWAVGQYRVSQIRNSARI
jgi:3-hydroxyisobutyrate dehydrogenase-like beta-hydroxyacid dehydrogenase